MKRLFLLLLVCLAACVSAQLRYDIGWEKRVAPAEGVQRRVAKSVANGPGSSVWVVSELTPVEGLSYLEVRRYTALGEDIGLPTVIAVDDRNCVNPTIVPSGLVGASFMTLIYERVNPVDGVRTLSCALLNGGDGTLYSNNAVATIRGLAKVKARESEGAVYVLATLPYWETFNYVAIFRFVGGSYTVPVMDTRQAEEYAVDFEFDPAGDVYFASSVVSSRYGFNFGRISKRRRTTDNWPLVWSRDLLVNATETLQLDSLTYEALNGRIVAGCSYYRNAADSRPVLAFFNLSDGGYWWWYWGQPAEMTNVKLSFIQAVGNRVRVGAQAWSVGSPSLRRWHYMDVDSSSGFAYWWFSATGEGARVNAMATTTTGETITGFADPSGNSTRWYTGKPVPGTSFDPIAVDGEGSVQALAPTPDGDMLAVGTVDGGDIVSRLYLPSMPSLDIFDGLKEGRSNQVNTSVLLNDSRKVGAIAVKDGEPHQSTQGNPLELNADGTFTYFPLLGYSGRDTFFYKARRPTLNGYVDSASCEVRLYITDNRKPVAVDDTAWTYQDKPKAVYVLSNDTDSDGDPLSIISAGSPANGRAIVDGNVIRYKPNPGFIGTDTFEYLMRDDVGNSDVGLVTVSVKLVPVTLSSISPTLVNAGSPDLTLTLTGTNFNEGTKAFAGDVELATTFTSSTSATCLIPASMLEIEHLYSITVKNPNGAISNAKTLRVKGTSSLQLVLVSFVRDGSNLIANMELRNSGTGTSSTQSITGALLNSKVTTTPMPIELGPVPPRDARAFSVVFTSLKSGTVAKLKIDLTANGSTRRLVFDVVAP